MPLARRIIPCLDVDAGRVVKGVRFVDIRDAGDPVEISKLPTPWKWAGSFSAGGYPLPFIVET